MTKAMMRNKARTKMASKDKRISARKTGATSAELIIYDVIGDEFFGVTAKMIADELGFLGDDIEDITVRINSPGGSVFEGTAIHNLLKQHKAKITVLIDGWAASIASIIAMAGDDIQIGTNAFIMIHNPWAVAYGEADELRRTADNLDQIRDVLVLTYAERTGGDVDEISEMMAVETWMTGPEAVERGFADSVYQAKEQVAACATDFVKKYADHFKSVPDNVLHFPGKNARSSKLSLDNAVARANRYRRVA